MLTHHRHASLTPIYRLSPSTSPPLSPGGRARLGPQTMQCTYAFSSASVRGERDGRQGKEREDVGCITWWLDRLMLVQVGLCRVGLAVERCVRGAGDRGCCGVRGVVCGYEAVFVTRKRVRSRARPDSVVNHTPQIGGGSPHGTLDFGGTMKHTHSITKSCTDELDAAGTDGRKAIIEPDSNHGTIHKHIEYCNGHSLT